jgi:hypothetical protein
LTPDWTKVFEDNYCTYSAPTGAGADNTTKMKIPVFEYWHKQFQDLIELKGLDAAAKFMNTNILTSSGSKPKPKS